MMNCPVCRSELMITGMERLETLIEHVENPNGKPSLKRKYECFNKSCPSRGTVMWDEFGELYIIDFRQSQKLQFIDNNDGPFGSSWRGINVEVEKKDENFILLHLGFIKFRIEWVYKSNENGDILKKAWFIQILHRSGRSWIYGSTIFRKKARQKVNKDT